MKGQSWMEGMFKTDVERHLPSNAGIAIGPILFIIAILAILAAAIAAGSGSFTAGTSSESARTKASALIQIGENLRVGMDRLIQEGGYSLSGTTATYDINALNTTQLNALFSPVGGGISAPSAALSNTPGTDKWYYPLVGIPNLGTGDLQLAVLKIDPNTCDQINNKANGLTIDLTNNGSTAGVGVDLGDFTTASPGTASNWPANLTGKTIGCVHNTDATSLSSGYFFYEVLAFQ